MVQYRTTKSAHVLVQAVESVSDYLDDEEKYPLSDELYAKMEGHDDRKISGAMRRKQAQLVWFIHNDPEMRKQFSRDVTALRNRMSRNPSRWFCDGRPSKRLYPKTITRKAVKAKRHRCCSYCDYHYAGPQICGVCRENGIDGKMIHGTCAQKATTYLKWSVKKCPPKK